jgi:hypothetical protein
MYNATYLRNLVDQLENQIVSSIRASYTVAKAHGYSGSFSQFYEEVRPQNKPNALNEAVESVKHSLDTWPLADLGSVPKGKRTALTAEDIGHRIQQMQTMAKAGVGAASRIHELRSVPDLFEFRPQEEAIALFLKIANLHEDVSAKLRADIEEFLGPAVDGRLIIIYPESVGDILDFNDGTGLFRVEVNIGISVKDAVNSEYPDRCETPMAENFQQSGQYGKPPEQFSADWKENDRKPVIKTIIEWASLCNGGISSNQPMNELGSEDSVKVPFDVTKLYPVAGKVASNENDAKISDQVRADMENMTMLIPVDKDGNPTALSPEYGAVVEKWLVPNTTPK